ncbi:MAG: ParB/RepB/Spo0J family partition protein [Bowdeniella nasicola]|nr:ParB/RepB/Spo0J family partition protein [Bowdeniella nasicola]
MSEKRRGLGRGIEALIPTSRTSERPSDIFFSQREAGSSTPAVRGSVRENTPGTPDGAQEETTSPAPQQVPERKTATSGRTSRGTKRATRTSSPGTSTARKAKAGTASGKDTRTGAPAPSRRTKVSHSTPPSHDTPGKPVGAADVQTPGEDGLVPVPGLRVATLQLDDISPNTRQPRDVFDEDDLEELAASIREVGLLQPIVVREATAESGVKTPYELIMGERRWRASRLAGESTITAIIRSIDDDDLLRDALLENLHRANLNPLEEASAYRQLLEDFDCTHDELARRIARSRPQISNTLRLLKLPPLVQRRVAAGVLSAGHARALLGLTDAAAMERLAQRIVAEGLSVRATEEIIALGDDPISPERRRRRVPSPAAPALNELATRLADRFDTKVKVAMGQRKGRITVEFAGLEDLDRILEILAPGTERPETPADTTDAP